MLGVEIVERDGRMLALVVRSTFEEKGTVPHVDEGMPLQVVSMNRDAGDMVGVHIHPPSRGSDQRGRFRHELLHVIEGSLEVGVYDSAGGFAENVLLAQGDTILLTEGHSTRFLEKTRVLEVKEGTYPGKEGDKVWLSREGL